MGTLIVKIDSCPPGINQTYGIKGDRGKGQKGLYKTPEATNWATKASYIIGNAAGNQGWEDQSKYYSIEIIFSHPLLDVDAPIKLIIDTVAQKLNFSDRRIVEQSSRKIVDDKESVTIILRDADQMKLSFSRVDMYSTCPELWRQVYLLKNKTPWSLDASYGNIVHRALKEYWETGFEGSYESIENDDWEYFDRVEQQKLTAQKLVKEGIRSLEKVKLSEEGICSLSPELHVTYPDFQGYFDLLVSDCIVDWKIVNSNYDKHRLLTSEQLTCYAWLHYRQFGYLPRKVVYVNLNKWTGESKVLSTTRTMEDITYWEKKVEAVRKMIDREIYYKEPRGCVVAKDTFCHFYDQCWGSQKIELSDNMLKFK